MIVPDVNLLVYAYISGMPRHDAARRWWEGMINGAETVGLAWAVISGFTRLTTNPRLISPPMQPAQSIGLVREWLRYAHVSTISPGSDHLDYFQRNLDAAGAGADLVPDAHIAALAMEHGAEVHSNDSDFDRFPGLLWSNPLT